MRTGGQSGSEHILGNRLPDGWVPRTEYRRDIDGLRALAVVPVVLAHASIRGFSGGFVGVDIFFVISGYLITSILVRDLALGHYSIAHFYRRRILRIFPVLFSVMTVVTAVACLTMLPVELVRYARSLGSAALFSSNILFYQESGYFDTVSTTKPLLHTWSLAIEEQFYILWPLMLAAIGAYRPTALKVMVAIVTIISFVVSILMMRWDISATFYLLPSRAWELGLGAMLALWGNPLRQRWLNELGAAVGLAAILFCIWIYDEYTAFPGMAALLPCAGAVLLIATGGRGTTVGKLLSFGPAVFIGQISYSLYMWHWPIIVFGKIAYLLPRTDPMVQAVEVVLAFIIAILSWRFMERPFRRNLSGWSSRRILKGAALAILLFVAVAGLLLALKGLPWRYSSQERAIAAYLDVDGEQMYRRGTCFRVRPGADLDPACLQRHSDRPALLLLGDSHAAHLWPGFAVKSSRYEVLQATMAGCRPVLHPDPLTACQRLFNDMLTRWAPHNRPVAVLLSANWRPADLARLDRTLADPHVRALNPIVIGPIPQYTAPLPRLLAIAGQERDPGLLERSYLDVAFTMDRDLRTMTKRRSVTYISLVDMLCHDKHCRTLAADSVPMQFDYSHLTAKGSALVVAQMLPQIDAAIAAHGANSVADAGGRLSNIGK